MSKVLTDSELKWGKSSRSVADRVVSLAGQPEPSAGTEATSAESERAAPAQVPRFREVMPSNETRELERHRRHARFHQRLLHSSRIQQLLGLLVTVGVPAVFSMRWGFWHQASQAQWLTLVAAAMAYLVAAVAVQNLARLPRTQASLLVMPLLTVSYGTSWLLLRLLGIEFFGTLLLGSYLTAMVLFTIGYLVSSPYRRLRFAVVPHGKAAELCQDPRVDWHFLETPGLEGIQVDGVVADLRAGLSEPWQRFLADCTLHRIPVHHATSVFEQITGRVYLHDNRLGSMQPDEHYEVIKRCLDVLGTLLIMPVALPLMVATALAIRLESPGAVLFTQPRMGLHCRPFTVYKFRSMYVDQQGGGFTRDGHDPRITRVGRVIRKYRIDELPQLLNVLKGDMSLIGPRPESMDLSLWYRDDVPFFHYRHVVRPGISGWAQVEQGYAAEVDEMCRKLEYDFYYIKHFSFWLDVLIVIRTIRTVLTGFGSR
ncbi:exopolysaccharide biosynthesis polyprenyl glycosylphosphotransferase [Halomonas mongoliensis]|uniref:Exopolysaccharide biosynthesis polyprenyl glycosylphosphotransferase n=1 Tax=Halomonas mongoliensis TaxID=321265 RepID=A0ABU1GJD5_9GAMM|nr:exopolysaccharide biosynthesis polyprenyl glycosylphosphotransferase [Halomonas mongoliensis]MDR5891925.1 exopolysaccharide biosynthesis polyprenyl glycosylphosphotransferase [Halomonas mongoliensis]